MDILSANLRMQLYIAWGQHGMRFDIMSVTIEDISDYVLYNAWYEGISRQL